MTKPCGDAMFNRVNGCGATRWWLRDPALLDACLLGSGLASEHEDDGGPSCEDCTSSASAIFATLTFLLSGSRSPCDSRGG